MNAKKQDRTFEVAFAELASDDTVSAIELTDLINEFAQRELSDKTVRAHLRSLKTRDQSVMKNAVWRIDYTIAERELNYFTRKTANKS